MDYKLELVLIPVTDIDRAKAFYTDRAGFTLEVDTKVNDQIRVVQATPPGSACSIGFGTGITKAEPGSVPPPAEPGTPRGKFGAAPTVRGASGPALMLLGAAVLACSMWFFVARVWAPPLQSHFSDLYPRWYGSRALLVDHRDPYSPAVTTRDSDSGLWTGRAPGRIPRRRALRLPALHCVAAGPNRRPAFCAGRKRVPFPPAGAGRAECPSMGSRCLVGDARKRLWGRWFC